MFEWFVEKLCKDNRGFTLIELVVVIAILGILAAIAVPRMSNQAEKARRTADEATARTIVGAINMAIAEGELELKGDGLYTTGENSVNKTNEIVDYLVTNKYLDETPKSQWVKDNNFTVTVSESKITITVDTDKQVYPIQK